MPRRGENIHKRSDGRWEGRYRDGYDKNGKTKYSSVYAKSYLEVKSKLMEANKRMEAKQEKKRIPYCMTFREALYLWLENNQIKLRQQTYAKYQRLIEQHIIPELGTYTTNELTASVVNRFLASKSENGRLDGNGGLSPSYIRTIAFIVTSALDFAIKQGCAAPLAGDVVRPIKKRNDLEVLSMKEQTILETAMKTDIDSQKFGILLSLYAGLRIGEICGLKWNDIDFENNTIHIRRTVERIPNIGSERNRNKTKLVVGEAKTPSSNRIIPIPSALIKLFLKHAASKSLNDYVIQGKMYPYTDPRTLQYKFHNYLEQCGLRHMNFHSLRHTFATRCIESGMDIKTLSEILGHANVNITLNTYVHSSMEQKRLQINSMIAFCGQ